MSRLGLRLPLNSRFQTGRLASRLPPVTICRLTYLLFKQVSQQLTDSLSAPARFPIFMGAIKRPLSVFNWLPGRHLAAALLQRAVCFHEGKVGGRGGAAWLARPIVTSQRDCFFFLRGKEIKQRCCSLRNRFVRSTLQHFWPTGSPECLMGFPHDGVEPMRTQLELFNPGAPCRGRGTTAPQLCYRAAA